MMNLFILLLTFTGGMTYAQDSITITVMSYNTQHGEGTDGFVDLARTARVISSASPDLVGLQEIDSMCNRTGDIDELAVYAQETGMQKAFGRAMSFDGGGYGNGILSKLPLSNVRSIALPGNEPRMALIADAETSANGGGSVPVTFITTHFDVSNGDAELQSATILNAYAAQNFTGDQLVILCGDFNCGAGSAAIQESATSWEIAAFDFSIDWIVYRPAQRWRLVSVQKLTSGESAVASDHLPVACS
jgi:endonuclease/exonuclease/phosphatase family metal-dependent hydrolase